MIANLVNTRTCYVCRLSKPLTDFPGDRREVHGKAYRCKVCDDEKRRQNYLKDKYEFSDEEYAVLAEAQNHVCAICGQPETGSQRLAVDHDSLGVRGLLCFSCNTGLGKFRDDSEILEKAVKYLRDRASRLGGVGRGDAKNATGRYRRDGVAPRTQETSGES